MSLSCCRRHGKFGPHDLACSLRRLLGEEPAVHDFAVIRQRGSGHSRVELRRRSIQRCSPLDQEPMGDVENGETSLPQLVADICGLVAVALAPHVVESFGGRIAGAPTGRSILRPIREELLGDELRPFHRSDLIDCLVEFHEVQYSAFSSSQRSQHG